MVVYKKICIIVVMVFAVSLSPFALALAEGVSAGVDARPYKFVQGFVSEESTWELTINEHLTVYILFDTKVLDSSENELAQESFRGHKWVYIEGPIDSYGNVEAKSIYLMPHYIKIDERSEYPFIKTP